MKVSPDYPLRDALKDNEVSEIRELAELRESTSPSQQEIAAAMIRAVLVHREGKKDLPGIGWPFFPANVKFYCVCTE